MKKNIYWVDAFTSKPFGGNPAVVVISDSPLDEIDMKSYAAEFNVSETAFCYPIKEGYYSLRWFTPTTEMKLCGHATLASAASIFDFTTSTEVCFSTLSGDIHTSQNNGEIKMEMPLVPISPVDKSDQSYDLISKSLRADIVSLHRSEMKYLVELKSEKIVSELSPNFSLMYQLDRIGVIVTSKSDKHDFVSRFFAPKIGVLEDPVTGSAHCSLAPFWGEKLNKKVLVGKQVSARGGVVKVELCEDKVNLFGSSCFLIKGTG